jgi:glyoxylase-like metal-dependent hydrolase (beta-lactamase superfamily II)
MKYRQAPMKRLFILVFLLGVPALVLLTRSHGQEASGPAGVAPDAKWTPVKSIDFSSKHNVLIKSEDGTLTPMDVPYFRSELIAPGTWRILSDGDYAYLLEGDNEALAIDSTYGSGNIREYMQSLTKKPLRYVANTHDHFDHTANDAYFDRAYMSEKTREKATIPFQSFSGMDFPRNYPIQVIGDGYKFQLGNREVEVFVIPNHTAGGTAYLDKRERILFSGDEIFKGGISISPTGSVAQYARNMEKLEAHRKEFDRLATGGFGVIEAAWVDRFLANANYILAGHEGEAVTAQQRRPQPPADPSAPLVYNRKTPRPGDGGAGPGGGTPNPNIRRMTYDDCSITYDTTRVKN